MAYKILIPQAIPQVGYDYLLAHGCEVAPSHGNNLQAILQDVSPCDAILARRGKYPAEVMDAAPRLKVIGRFGAGVDSIDVAHAEKLGIVVTNAPAANSNAVAEHTIYLMMACAKRAHEIDVAFRGGDFGYKDQCIGTELSGNTLGLLGFGRIAGLVAQKAALGLDMRVFTYSRHLSQEQCPPYVTLLKSREALFERCNFVSVHIPSTSETRGSIDAELLCTMKPTAYLINTARGDIVCEADLISALKCGALAGAGLDVFENEPPTLANPLFCIPNVIVTPHYAAFTQQALEQMALDAAAGIVQVLKGERPMFQVNVPSEEVRRHRQD